MIRKPTSLFRPALSLFVTVLFLLSLSAMAQVITPPQKGPVFRVTNLLDDGSAGSLRVELAAAQAAGATSIVDMESVSGVITLSQGELAVTQSVVIDGPKAPNTITIDGGGVGRVFDMTGGETTITVSIFRVTIQNGSNTNSILLPTIASAHIAVVSNPGEGGDIYANNTDLTLTNSAVAGGIALQGGGIYIANSSILTLNTVNIHDNTAESVNSNDALGGGIYAEQITQVTGSGSIFKDNKATGEDGGPDQSGTAGVGGAIYTENEVTLGFTNCTFDTNSAIGGAGGAGNTGATDTVGDNGGNGGVGEGGAIYANTGSAAEIFNAQPKKQIAHDGAPPQISLTGCQFTNSAAIGGAGGAGGTGGIGATAGTFGGAGGAGGKAQGGTLELLGANSRAINITLCTINGSASNGGTGSAVNGGAGGQGGAGGATSIGEGPGGDNTGGNAGAGGDAAGGGLYVTNNANVTILQSTISECVVSGGVGAAGGLGQGIPFGGPEGVSSTGGDGEGGGVYIDATASLHITFSTVSSNSALGGAGGAGSSNFFFPSVGGAGGEGAGAGLYAAAGDPVAFTTGSSLTIIDSTVTSNVAAGALGGSGSTTGASGIADGGGLYGEGTGANNGQNAAVQVTSCTVSGNSANGGLGGGIGSGGFPQHNTATVISTIIAGNTAATGPDVNGAFLSSSSNFIGIGDTSTGFTNGTNNDQVGTSSNPILAQLGPLGDNGGPTQTLALPASSPAANADFADPVTTDQRGVPRPSVQEVGNNDIGAYQHTTTFSLAPTTVPSTIASTPDGDNNFFRSGSVQVILTATEPNVPASSLTTYYTTDGSAPSTSSPIYDGPITFTTDGTHVVTFFSTDGHENQEAPAQTKTVTLDSTPPVTGIAVSPASANGSGFYKSSEQVTLTPTDATSGVATTFYTLDGGTQVVTNVPTAPIVFTVSGEGTHTVVFYSVDKAGNIEDETTTIIKIDLTKPHTTAQTQTTATGEQVTLTATDSFSGVASTVYTIDGGGQQTYSTPFLVQGNGPHTVLFHSTDRAGNVEDPQTAKFTINIAAPVTKATLAGPQGTSGWYTGSVTVTLKATSGASVVRNTFYTLDGVTKTYTAPFPVTGDKVHTLAFYSTDTAGNTEATNNVLVKIDSVPPVTTLSQASVSGGTQVTLAATDATSGVAKTTYTIDGGAVTTYTAPFTVASGSSHQITYASTDVAGNTEASKTTTVASSLPILHIYTAGLQMISVPENYSGVATALTLSDPSHRRVTWNPLTLQYDTRTDLTPGVGYWVRFSQTTDLYDEGVPTPTTKPFVIALQPGWNEIGNPYRKSVVLSGITVQDPIGTTGTFNQAITGGVISGTLYTFPAGASAYQSLGQDASLNAYQGYWIYAYRSCSLLIPAP